MCSTEIARLTGKEHFNVVRDIKVTLEAANIDALRFERVYEGGNGESRPCYYLPKFELDLVVSGYSVPYRAAIIKRWHELEAEKDVTTTHTPAGTLGGGNRSPEISRLLLSQRGTPHYW